MGALSRFLSVQSWSAVALNTSATGREQISTLRLEAHRPDGMIAHRDAVFMCDNDQDIDAAGGGTEYVFTLMPRGPVQRHDMNWASEISGLLEDAGEGNQDLIAKAADNYWRGVPHHNESLWEYLTPSAEIVRLNLLMAWMNKWSPWRMSSASGNSSPQEAKRC